MVGYPAGCWLTSLCISGITNDIDGPTKHSLLLTKLTNLSSEWKAGCFFRLKTFEEVNELIN